MKKEVTDDLGTYEVNIKMKPKELIDIKGSAIYLNLFENEESPNACRYKLSLGVVDEKNKSKDWYCSILNHWEPARWLRSIPEEVRDNPFYRQMQLKLNEIKRLDVKFVKSPSAGFFKAPRTKGMEATKRPIIPNATAMLFIEEGELPYVIMRFMDITWEGELLNKTGNGPKWGVCLKNNLVEEEVLEVDINDYF